MQKYPELTALVASLRSPDDYYSWTLILYVEIGIMMIFGHYIQQLDISRLTIQKFVIKK
jgi:hypothetical protein